MLAGLLMEHHHVEQALLIQIREGRLTRDTWADSSLRSVHDDLERDILLVMAQMTDEEIRAAIDAYDKEGGYL